MCDAMKFSEVVLTAGLFIAVCAQQQPIIDKEYVPVGGMFTVTCDASRFPPGTIPSNLNVITELGMVRFVDGGRREPIATYRPFPIPGFSNVSKFFPTGRNWAVEASGGVASGDDTTNNKVTIKLELVVKDAKCSDAGIYSCNASSSMPVTGTELYANSQRLKGDCSTGAHVGFMDSQRFVRSVFLMEAGIFLCSRWL